MRLEALRAPRGAGVRPLPHLEKGIRTPRRSGCHPGEKPEVQQLRGAEAGTPRAPQQHGRRGPGEKSRRDFEAPSTLTGAGGFGAFR